MLADVVRDSTTVTSTTWSADADYARPSTAKVTEDAWLSMAKVIEDARPSMAKVVEDALYRVVIVCVCVFGLVCNIINLLVLSRKSLTATMERLERSAHYGLVGERSVCLVLRLQ